MAIEYNFGHIFPSDYKIICLKLLFSPDLQHSVNCIFILVYTNYRVDWEVITELYGNGVNLTQTLTHTYTAV
jgi:hypothetical protein